MVQKCIERGSTICITTQILISRSNSQQDLQLRLQRTDINPKIQMSWIYVFNLSFGSRLPTSRFRWQWVRGNSSMEIIETNVWWLGLSGSKQFYDNFTIIEIIDNCSDCQPVKAMIETKIETMIETNVWLFGLAHFNFMLLL